MKQKIFHAKAQDTDQAGVRKPISFNVLIIKRETL